VALAGAVTVYCVLVALSTRVTFWSVVMPVSCLAYLSVPLVGAAIARADRRNAVGWMLMLSGVTLPGACAAYLVAEAQFNAAGVVGSRPCRPSPRGRSTAAGAEPRHMTRAAGSDPQPLCGRDLAVRLGEPRSRTRPSWRRR
jgi:hypothetical protein